MNKEIEENRRKINELDDQIIKLLEERFFLTNKIGNIKKENKLNVENKNREKEIMEIIFSKSKNYTEYIQNIYHTIINESKRNQNE